MSKATESYEKLGLYISNDGFTFDISKEPTIMWNGCIVLYMMVTS